MRYALILSLLLAGCGQKFEDLSAGYIGCPPSQITISNFTQSGNACSWEASCNGKNFQCTETGSQQVYCTAFQGS